MAEEGVSGEVLWLLLDMVGLLLALFNSLSLIVEKLEEDTPKSFDLIESTRRVNFGVFRQVNIFSILHIAVKL
jgi:hypothetical protein